MKIEKGKFYRSRDGRKWEVLTTERNNEFYPVIAMSSDGKGYNSFSKDGKLVIASNEDCDLIAEWTEPVIIPWDDYPKWCKWVGMNKNGQWSMYSGEPVRVGDGFSSYFVGTIPLPYIPKNFTGDWTESLFERPCNTFF